MEAACRGRSRQRKREFRLPAILSLSLSFCARGLTSKAVRRVHTNGERLNKCVGELERAVISLSWTSYKTPAALLYLYLAD